MSRRLVLICNTCNPDPDNIVSEGGVHRYAAHDQDGYNKWMLRHLHLNSITPPFTSKFVDEEEGAVSEAEDPHEITMLRAKRKSKVHV